MIEDLPQDTFKIEAQRLSTVFDETPEGLGTVLCAGAALMLKRFVDMGAKIEALKASGIPGSAAAAITFSELGTLAIGAKVNDHLAKQEEKSQI